MNTFLIGIGAGILGGGLVIGIILLSLFSKVKKSNKNKLAKKAIKDKQFKALINAVIKIAENDGLSTNEYIVELKRYNLTEEEISNAILAARALKVNDNITEKQETKISKF